MEPSRSLGKCQLHVSLTLVTFVQFFTWFLCSTMIFLWTITTILLLLDKFTVYHFSNHLNKLVILYRCVICRSFVCLAVFLNSCPIQILHFLLLCLALYCSIWVYLAVPPDHCLTPTLQLLHLCLTLHCSIYVYRHCCPSVCILLLALSPPFTQCSTYPFTGMTLISRITAGCYLLVLTTVYIVSTSFVLQLVIVLSYLKDISCALPTLLLSNSQSTFSVAALNKFQSICQGLLPSALTHVQSNSSDLPFVTGTLAYCQSKSQCYSIALTLTSVQSVQSHMPSLEGSLSNPKCIKSTYFLMIKKYSLNHYIKLLCISDSVSQLALCQYQVEFSLHEHIFLEDPILVQVVHKLGLMFWKFLLEIWIDVSPPFCFVLELCHNIIIENQNFMAF